MPKPFVEFKAIMSSIRMEEVIKHYDLTDRFKKSGDSLSGPCHIHKGNNPTQFRINLSKNFWNCFNEYKHGGNVRDFIAKMENVSVHAAALNAIEWFNLNVEAVSASSEDKESEETGSKIKASDPASKSDSKEPQPSETTGPNNPLKFRLELLDRYHP